MAGYCLVDMAQKMPSRTDFLAFDITSPQAQLWTQSEQTHGSYRTLTTKLTPASQQLSSRMSQGLLFLPPKLHILGQEGMGCVWAVFRYLNSILTLNGHQHLTDSTSSPSLVQLSLSPWVVSVLMFDNAAFSVRLLQVWSPETAIVTAWHLPAGFFSCPRGFCVATKYNWGGPQYDQGAFPYDREAESLKHKSVYIYIRFLYIGIRGRAHVFCKRNFGRFFPYLGHLFPFSTLLLLPLEITVTL